MRTFSYPRSQALTNVTLCPPVLPPSLPGLSRTCVGHIRLGYAEMYTLSRAENATCPLSAAARFEVDVSPDVTGIRCSHWVCYCHIANVMLS